MVKHSSPWHSRPWHARPWLRRSLLWGGGATLGAAYFSTFSNLDISLFFKGYVTLIPVQIIALIAVFYFKRRAKERQALRSTPPNFPAP